ncbi:MAG: GIY-YIG nuclease family protein [Bacteroidota bacterium]
MPSRPLSKGGYVYIMTNATNTVLYVGVTSDIFDRVQKHKTCFYPGSFTSRYKVFKLVYVESHNYISNAIAREKQLKAGSRKKKIALIDAFNPERKDLFEELDKLI